MRENRLNTDNQPTTATHPTRDFGDQQNQLGAEIVAQVKQLAVAKPVIVVAAGLALGVMAGIVFKRK